jgi:hypothetical protein
MPLPCLTVLDRVKAFLPQIEEANRQLDEEIKTSGTCSKQIDADLLGENDGTVDSEGAVDGTAAPSSTQDGEGQQEGDNETVKIEFALGDFDDTPIAAMEEAAKEEAAGVAGKGEADDDEDDLDIQVLKTK